MKVNFSRVIMTAGLAVAVARPAPAATTTWQIDPRHTSANFAVTHLMISTVRGQFHQVTGTIVVDDQDISRSSVTVTIDASTIDTQEPDRDKHLKSPDFFDVANFPALTFKSTKVEQLAPGKLKVTGDLTIRGVTRQAVLQVNGLKPPIKDPWGLQRTAASATATINRRDFGVAWNKALDSGGFVVGDEVNISIDVEMVVPPPDK